MNLYPVFNYLVNIVSPFMVQTGDCLYNALVRTLNPTVSPSNPTPLSTDALIDIRESARHLIQFIDQEIQARADEDAEAAAIEREISGTCSCGCGSTQQHQEYETESV